MSEYWSDGKTEDTVDVNEETIFNLFEDIRCLKEPAVPVSELAAFASDEYEHTDEMRAYLRELIAKAKGGER
jgi:hypothetical protein